MSLIGASDLAMMRDIIDETLPDVCNILGESLTSDGQGGVTSTWGVTAGSVICRLDSVVKSNQGLTLVGESVRPEREYTLSLPYNTAISPGDRVEIGAYTFTVTSVNEGISWAAVKRATLRIYSRGLDEVYYRSVIEALGSSLIGYWPLWETTGSSAVDMSGNGRNGVYTNVTLSQDGMGDGNTAAKFVDSPASKMNPYSAGLSAAANLDDGYVSLWVKIDDAAKWADANAYYFVFLSTDFTQGIIARKTGSNLTVYRRKGAQVAAIVVDVPTTARWFHLGFAWSVTLDKEWVYLNGAKKIPLAVDLSAMGAVLASAGTVFGSSTGASGNWPGYLAHIAFGAGTPANLDESMRLASRQTGLIIFDGDSRSTDKNWTTASVETAFPTGDFVAGGRGVATWSISGQTVATMLANAPANIDPLLKPNGTVVIWGGINDNGASTAQQIYNNLKAYCQARTAAGWKNVVLCTEIGSTAAGWTAKYQALNALIAADHSFATVVADLGADVRLQDATNLTYFTDGTHLTDAGYSIVGGIVSTALAGIA